jgi:uncharacterized coiled-coil DUF342 family protein
MAHTFTQDHLILYAYNELKPEVAEALKKALETDPVLRDSYNELQETMTALDQGKTKPHATNVQIIKEESQSADYAEPTA